MILLYHQTPFLSNLHFLSEARGYIIEYTVKLERNLGNLEKSAKIKIGGNPKEVFVVMHKNMSMMKCTVMIKCDDINFLFYTGGNRISTQS